MNLNGCFIFLNIPKLSSFQFAPLTLSRILQPSFPILDLNAYLIVYLTLRSLTQRMRTTSLGGGSSGNFESDTRFINLPFKIVLRITGSLNICKMHLA